MKPNRAVISGLLMLGLAVPTAAEPVGTDFTYQGRLETDGAPSNGSHDFEFRLHTSAVGDNQVGPTICADNVDLVDGLFTVSLDFGTQYDGDARWLEVGVRADETNGNCFGGLYTTLAPRQPLSAAPYAVHALNAGQWINSGSAIMNTNTGFVGINRDYTVGLEWFGVHAPVNSGYGGMYVTTEGATAWPFYGYRAGSQAAWTYLDGATGDWHLNVDGNRLTVTDGGMVGIRTSSPVYPLHVVGTNTDRTIHGENSTSTGVGVRGQATHATGSNTGVYGETLSSSGTAVRGFAAASSGQTTGGRFIADSASGTGVDASGGFIGVVGSAWSSAGETWGGLFQIQGPSGAGVRGLSNSSSGTGKGVWGSSASPDGVGVYGTNTSNGTGVYGVLGELTNPASSGAGVHGVSHYYGVSGLSTGVGGVGVEGRGENGPGVGVSGVGGGYGVMGVQSDPAFSSGVGVLGFSGSTNSGVGVSGVSYSTTGTPRGVEGHVDSAIGYAGYFTGGRNYFQGRVGLGTLTPANPLSVVGDADISGRVSIGITGADARLLVRGTAGEDAFRVRVEGSTKLLVKDNGGVGIGSNFGAVPTDGLRVLGNVGIGIDPTDKLHVSGNIRATGSVFASCGTLTCSDQRFKTNVMPLAGALDTVEKLRPVAFDWKREEYPDRQFTPQRQTGLIAQQVREVLPDVVQQDGDGYLSVDYGRLTPLLVEAMRELRAEKDAAIAQVKAENDELRRRLARLEAAIAPQRTN